MKYIYFLAILEAINPFDRHFLHKTKGARSWQIVNIMMSLDSNFIDEIKINVIEHGVVTVKGF